MPTLQPLGRVKFAPFVLEFQDVDSRPVKPLPHARVRVELLDASGKSAGTLFQGRSNAQAMVAIRVPIPLAVAGQPPQPLRRVRITVLDLDGDELHRQDLQPEVDKPIPTIKVSDEPQNIKTLAPIGDGVPVLGRAVSRSLADQLRQNKVDSLATLRKADPAAFVSLSGLDKQDFADLLVHAQLQLVSRNHKTNQALVQAGYRSLLDVARQSRSAFVAKVKAQIPEDTAGRMHLTARRQVQVLGNLHTQQLARQVNGMAPLSYGGPVDEQPCDCNCGSAVSPQAYLVDLLDYAVDNVLFEGNSVDLQKLEVMFGQPFAALPVDCAFADKLVRQVRLCVEVLQRRSVLLADNTLHAAVTSALVAHAPRAYEALLRGLGTSYRELRLVRSDEEARKRLADRLGIATNDVDRFRLEPNSADVDKQLNEDNLERLFGLQGTVRDPLSTGAKFKDGQGQMTRWQLRGVEWRKNTDELGRIHVSVSKRSNGMHEIILFKSQNRGASSRRAMGSTRDASGVVELAAENHSGLAGRIEFKYTANESDIYLAVVPEWAIRRKDRLRTLWQGADHPASDFAAPMVDPDIVAESDLMQPFSENPAHALWAARKQALQDRRNNLDAVGTITAILRNVFSAAFDLAEWEAIADKLQSADPNVIDDGKDDLRTLEANLTQETFSFLLELGHRDSANREIKPEEREQALDVLVNIHKAKQFGGWRTAEATANIRLSAPFFLLSEMQPALNPLRATAESRNEWRAELERNSDAPLIDPDIVSESNFAPGATSTEAYGTWEVRRKLVGDGRRADDIDLPARVAGDLFNALATINSEAKLNAALTSGDLPAGQPLLFHHIGFTAAETDAIKEAIQTGGKLPITPEQYGLTAAQLRTLFEVRRLDANADASDWEQVHHILVQAEKRRYLYPLWRIEERDSGVTLNPDVFHLASDALAELLPLLRLTPGFLQWRLDRQRQRAWRDQLRSRIEQSASVDAELQSAIDAAEEATLPALRDQLVMATVSANTGGESVDERKRWVMDHLLINAFENGCRKTTRVAQALETMQLLLWGIYNGNFEDPRYSLEWWTRTQTFGEEWQWLGSYATWRSAMFVFLYPENVLFPSLIRDGSAEFNIALGIISGVTAPSTSQTGNEASADSSSAESNQQEAIQSEIFRYLGETQPNTLLGIRKVILNMLRIRYDLGDTAQRIAETRFIYSSSQVINESTLVRESHKTGTFSGSVGRLAWVDETFELEDMFYLPIHGAIELQKKGDFSDALDLYRLVYDFARNDFRFSRIGDFIAAREGGIQRQDDLLADPLNPHRIAATRTGADVRFVILSIIRCLLEYADSEFARDTSESLARARELYETARRLLDSDQLGKKLGDCQDIIGTLISEIGEDEWIEIVLPELDVYQPPFVDPDSLTDKARDRLLDELKGALKTTNPPKPRSKVRQEVQIILARHFAPRVSKTVGQSRLVGDATTQVAYQRLLTQPKVFQQVQRVGADTSTASLLFVNIPNQGGIDTRSEGRWDRAPRVEFCIPRNPLIALLRMRFEVSWFKLNNCMNLAGQRREVPAYAAPTDTYSGMPVAEVGSTASFSAAARLVPTLYRYRVLIERARQLVAMAQQMEATYLSFLEKRDQEAYSILRARQDLGIARANVTLQDLRVTEAEDGKDLASLQFDRTEEAFEHYNYLIQEGLLGSEENALLLLNINVFLQGAVALLTTGGAIAAGLVAGGVIGIESGPGAFFTALGGGGGAAAAAMSLSQTAFSSATGALSTGSSIFSMQASFERREEEWRFQRDLAEIDQDIAEVQQTLAQDRYDITVQEKQISQMSAENASDVVNFLNTKFTNTELYAWMGGIVGGIYRYLLQEATTIAKLAQRQLAFERQETEPAVVLDDYWTYTDTSAILRGGSGSADRRGMTGSARLLQDITRLDQEAFLTDRRKLQLSKTFSLALHDPIAFARFQESGVLPFSTALEQFDRNFPGHYLRMIKRVRVSVIALIPPIEGICATLSSSGISRVVRGGDTFAEIEIRRDPETIAFTSPINATGLFELQEQPEMLLPFEGNGVAATGWVFSLPRAANMVNYSTIADVLLTIEYTALESAIFRSQVIQQLDRTASGERPFSFRYQFADCWYDLSNPELLANDRQMRVTFDTRQSDFPPNVTDLRIEHVSLYFVCQDGFTDPIEVENLLFTEAGHAGQVGGAATTTDGLISTRASNGGSWLAMQGKEPVGRWELKLPNTAVAKDCFKSEKVKDVLFVITFSGTTPAWPA